MRIESVEDLVSILSFSRGEMGQLKKEIEELSLSFVAEEDKDGYPLLLRALLPHLNEHTDNKVRRTRT